MKIKITPAQEKNLQKLIKYLRKELKAKFDMEIFSERGGGYNAIDCGSVGCVIGHGPYAGVRKRKNESWFDYSARKFGLPLEGDEWNWCFSAIWHRTDNTPPARRRELSACSQRACQEIGESKCMATRRWAMGNRSRQITL